MPATIDLTGRVFNLLTVVRRLGKDRARAWLWESVCVCGTICVHSSAQIKFRYSCGCATQANRIAHSGRGEFHNKTNSPEYVTWIGIKRRCGHMPGDPGSHRYAGRGITMCAEWRDSFSAFYEHLGAKPSPAHTVDRIDNALGYQPGNCRWADKIEQSENRAVTRYITLDGNTKSLSAWCRELGLSRHTVWRRLRGGASPEESLRACATPTQVLAGGRMRSIPECAEILGVNRESAYRLHRAGLLVSRVDSHHP